MTSNQFDFTYEIYLNSKFDREFNDTTSNWTTNFQSVNLDTNAKYGLALQSCQIPNVAPQFHEGDTNFKIETDTVKSFTYDNTEIFGTIEDMLLYITNLINISGLVISQDQKTKLCKIENNTGDTVKIDFSDEQTHNFFQRLGFEETTLQTLENTDSLTSISYPSLLGTSRFYIVCEEIANNSFSGLKYNSWSIFKSINCNAAFGNFCNFENTNDNNLYYHDIAVNGYINNLSFKILDDRMRPVDLKNMGVKMSLYLKKY